MPVANLPASTSRRFNPADYKEAPAFFTGRFLSQLNLFTDPVFVALSNGLTFSQNFNAQYFNQIVIAGATPGDNAFSFKQGIFGQPLELIIAACNLASDITAPLTAAVGISWYVNGSVIFVTSVSGLTSGLTYNLRLRLC